MSRYKASQYNYNSSLGKDYVWMNGVKGSIIQVNSRVHAQILRILADPNNCSTDQDRTLRDQLVFLGFLIGENFNEIEFLKLKNRIARYGNKGLGLAILPTLDCNFVCPYCYQSHVNKRMGYDVQQGIVKYVSKMMVSKSKLVVDWFGGEPLLEISQIKEFSSKFMQICEKNRARYTASITTNGYLLSKQMAHELSQIGVENVQVTIDGPPDIHNKRRILRDGRPTFDVILKNLGEATKYIPTVIVRVNIDKANSVHFPELLAYLAPLKEHLWIGIAPVAPIRVAQGYAEQCFQRDEYLKIEIQLEQLLKTEGFNSLLGTSADRRWLPSRSVFCGAYQKVVM